MIASSLKIMLWDKEVGRLSWDARRGISFFEYNPAFLGGGLDPFPLVVNPAKRNVLDLKNETCKNREKRNVLKISHTRHFKTTKKQSKTGCFYSF